MKIKKIKNFREVTGSTAGWSRLEKVKNMTIFISVFRNLKNGSDWLDLRTHRSLLF